jgi:osmotically-inducible protein OsmY
VERTVKLKGKVSSAEKKAKAEEIAIQQRRERRVIRALYV